MNQIEAIGLPPKVYAGVRLSPAARRLSVLLCVVVVAGFGATTLQAQLAESGSAARRSSSSSGGAAIDPALLKGRTRGHAAGEGEADAPAAEITGSTGGRVSSGLVAYYPLTRGEGSFAEDESGFGGPLDLALLEGATWLEDRNGVLLPEGAKLETEAAGKLHAAMIASGEFSFEVWVKAAHTEQEGPARILTYSTSPWQRNFMLGAEGSELRVRLRDKPGNENGMPEVEVPGAVTAAAEHYLVSYDGQTIRIYRNGALIATENRPTDLSAWSDEYFLIVGNEPGGNRSWQGEVYLVAAYARALGPLEVQRNFLAGSDPRSSTVANQPPQISGAGHQTVLLPTSAVELPASVDDDGLPANTLTAAWTQLSGPGGVAFGDPSSAATSASFSAPGQYELQLSATDGELTTTQVVVVNVVNSARVRDSLVAFYPFSELSGTVARDQAANGDPALLQMQKSTSWIGSVNGLRFDFPNEDDDEQDGLYGNVGDTWKIQWTLNESNALTWETWIKPASLDQAGATIFAYQQHHWDSNLVIVQDREGLQVRLRTSDSSDDGRPWFRVPQVFDGSPKHIAVTFDGAWLRIFINGEEAGATRREGNLTPWSNEADLWVATEDRERYGWAGEMYALAIYSRALSAPEIQRNFEAGWNLLEGGQMVSNAAPLVTPGDDRSATFPRNTIMLRAAAVDDGLPSGGIAANWQLISGPGEVTFANPGSLWTDATFSAPGEYLLGITASDGELTTQGALRVTMLPEQYPRILEQATWGPRTGDLERLLDTGIDGFLAEQFNAPVSEYPQYEYGSTRLMQELFAYHALRSPDQLRQRMAFALGQILVVSANTVGRYDQMQNFTSILMEHAFGNYYDLLLDATLSPTMGVFLDMVNNAAEGPESISPPNENYAREFLQLFSVGTTLLNPDGSPQLDGEGAPIPAYSEATVREFTKAFTGWTFPTKPTRSLDFPNPEYYFGPMEPVEEFHDHSEKHVLNGTTLPAGQTARQDLEQAIRSAFEHPNVGPFVSRQLIQHLVTSNPSPGYIERVASVFNDNGNGVRGDLRAVVTAILKDPEAAAPSPAGGHLREPVLYTLSLMRNLGAEILAENDLADIPANMGQTLFFPPSVFNYFSSNYVIPGFGVYGPEFQIHTKANALSRANLIHGMTDGYVGYGISLNLEPFVDLASEPARLVDALDQALFQGRISDKLREVTLNAVEQTEGNYDRMRTAIYIAATSSEYQVQH